MARSTYLVHWTGKDINTDLKSLTDDERRKYIEYLVGILREGFWMTQVAEHLTGCHARSTSGSVSFQYETHMTCFTEVRLSQSLRHAAEYGLLGVGVERKYVLDHWGSPVYYVRNHENEGFVGAFFDLRCRIIGQKSKGIDGSERAAELVNYLGTFFKAMSNRGLDDFRFLEENEWRIVLTEEQIRANKIICTGLSRPTFKIPLLSSDVRLVVFPDTKTRAMALSDAAAAPLIANGEAFPLLTLEECRQF
jgi:hypothetical protein